MTMQTIRKNATKKIQAYLDQSVGIIFFGKVRVSIDDSYDDTHKVVSSDVVLKWLADNYDTAMLLLEDDVLRFHHNHHCGGYFSVYLDKEQFDLDLAYANGIDNKRSLFHALDGQPKARPLPANVVSLCAYRQSLAG